MKLVKNIGLCVFSFLALHAGAQQGELRLGFRLCPGVSWMTTNVMSVSNVGSNATILIGTSGELGLSDHLSLVTGIGLTFNRGGTLRHTTGGNLLPNSRLSNDAYNSGQKPLPDGTKLKYNIQYLEVPVGLKWRSEPMGAIQYYAELPLLTWGLAVQRRGEIIAGDIHSDKENISRDVAALNISWGLGAGIEYPIDTRKSLVAGLHFTRGFTDITSDKARTAIPNPDHNPFDPNDDYIEQPEDSRAVLNSLVIRLGMLF